MTAKKRTHFPGRYNDWPKYEEESKGTYKPRRRLAARIAGFNDSTKGGRKGYRRPGSLKK